MKFEHEIGFGIVEVNVPVEEGEVIWHQAKIFYKGVEVSDIVHDDYRDELHSVAVDIVESGWM